MGWATRDVSVLLDKSLFSVKKGFKSKDEDYPESLLFTTSEGERYLMYHSQDCCESVTIDDICGELDDLVGSPIVMAEQSTNANENPENMVRPDESDEYKDESFLWTFYRIATARGTVVIRWYGSSIGYYSESVDFVQIESIPAPGIPTIDNPVKLPGTRRLTL